MDTNPSSEIGSSYSNNPVALELSARWGVKPHQAIEILLASTTAEAVKLMEKYK